MIKSSERERGEMTELPEDCIANILSFTTPRDACRLSLVSLTYKSAADSDRVWEKFLPSDYREILARSVPALPPFSLNDFSSKKELYFSLCDDPILLDNGHLSFSLEKSNGKKCFVIGARGISIIWSSSPEYWTRVPHPDSRFAEVAELILVWWLQIFGTIETQMLSPNTTYAAYLLVNFTENVTYRLANPPTRVYVEYVNGGGSASGAGRGSRLTDREDGWKEIALGEFYNDQGEDGEVKMSLTEVDHLGAKSGIIVEGMEIRPRGI